MTDQDERVPYLDDQARWQQDYPFWAIVAAWFDHGRLLEVRAQVAGTDGPVVRAGSLDELARLIDEQGG